MSASRPRPGTGISSTWSGCSCSPPSTSGAAAERPAAALTHSHQERSGAGQSSRAFRMRRTCLAPLHPRLWWASRSCSSSGFWQVRRLAWKEALLAGSRRGSPPPRCRCPAGARPGRRRVPGGRRRRQLIGDAGLHVLVSRREIGPGWRIVAPFETAAGGGCCWTAASSATAQQNAPHPGGADDVIAAICTGPTTASRATPRERPGEEHLVSPATSARWPRRWAPSRC